MPMGEPQGALGIPCESRLRLGLELFLSVLGRRVVHAERPRSPVCALRMTEWETATPAVAETPDIKLFGKWSTDDVQINDISLQDYIAVKEKYAKYLPHSAGRYAAKRFRKAQCPIVERLTNSMMMHGRNNGKKLMTVRIVKHAFEIIHLLTGENPGQVLVNAIINSGPREDSTRIGRAGTVRNGRLWMCRHCAG